MRDWKKFENDEIMTIWKGYLTQEFGNGDPLSLRSCHPKPIRLTPMEIIKLVDELMDRLEINESQKEGNILYFCKERGDDGNFRTIFVTSNKEKAEEWVNELPHKRCYQE